MILDKIVARKLKEIRSAKKNLSLDALIKKTKPAAPKFALSRALRARRPGIGVIAEIKRKSPSKGVIRKNFNPSEIARQYRLGGAAALSILTDKDFFGGSLEILKKVRSETSLPILRKEFILDEYQIYEARQAGANAILLIAAILSPFSMKKFYALATQLGMDTIFEVHDQEELKAVLPIQPKIIGINNRNLKTFEVDLAVTAKLAKNIPSKILIISESGIHTPEDIVRVLRTGAKAVLVGESLMKAPDPGQALQRLLGTFHG